MTLLRLVRDLLNQSGPEHWNPDEDEDILRLRAAKENAEQATAIMRKTGNIFEETVTGTISHPQWRKGAS